MTSTPITKNMVLKEIVSYDPKYGSNLVQGDFGWFDIVSPLRELECPESMWYTFGMITICSIDSRFGLFIMIVMILAL